MSQLLDRLDDRLALLAGGDRLAAGRHRSLAAAAEWSYQLLDEDERRVFRPAVGVPGAVHAGGGRGGRRARGRRRRCCGWWSARCWSRRGPARMAGPGTRCWRRCAATGPGCWRRPGSRTDAEAALARYAVRVAEQAAAGLTTITAEPAAARWLDAEDATMGHVLAWAVEHDLDTAARLVTALGLWWMLRGRLAGQEPLLRELAGRAEPGSDGWCAAQFWLAWTALDAADLPAALQRCAAVVDVIGDREPSRTTGGLPGLAVGDLGQPGPGPGGGRMRPPRPGHGPRAGLPVRPGLCHEWPGHRRLVRRRPGRCRAAGPAGRADPGHPPPGRPGVRLPAGRGAGRGGGPGRRRAGLRRHAGPGPGRGRPVYPGRGCCR